jgi:hypothetical protein
MSSMIHRAGNSLLVQIYNFYPDIILNDSK